MTQKEMIEASLRKFEEAKVLILKADKTDEDRQKADGLMSEARKLKEDAERLMTIDREGGVILAQQEAAAKDKPAPDPAPDGEWKTWGEFLQAAHTAKLERGRVDKRLHYFTEDRKDMSGATGEGGGFLIPQQFLARLMAVASEQALVRPRANIIPMASRSVVIPALKQTTALGEGQPPWFGGLLAYWIGEGEAKPASDADFRDIELVAKKLVMFTRAADELLADAAISLEAFLAGPQGMAGAIAWKEDYAFLRGNGVAQPLGIFNAPATLTVRRNVAGKIQYKDVVAMIVAFYGGTGVWAMSRTAYGELLQMEDTEGHLLWAGGMEGGSRTLMGYPYVVTEKMSRLGTTGDLALFDFSAYLLGDRQSTTIESTKFEAWQYDKTSWRAVHRVDGQPWLDAPLTLDDQVSQVSPFVLLSSDVS